LSETVKNLVKACLPSGAVYFLRRQKNILLYSSFLRKNRAVDGVFNGEDCFILATGPSINRLDLKLLRGRRCISVSNFFVHPDFALLKPVFHCIAPWHPPITEAAWQSWMLDLRAHVTDETTLVFGVRDFARNEGIFADFRRLYMVFGASARYITRRGISLGHPLLLPWSVPVMALQIAIAAGFSRIFLLGVQHDLILHPGVSSHFYAEKEDAKVRGGYSEWDGGGDMGTEFSALAALWEQYRAIRSVAERRNVRIVNLTEGSLLDVFERGSLGDFVS
jgi:hypothetical protein